MQKLIFTSILFLLFSFTKLSAQTVYIAETGKKYHTKTCPSVQSYKKEMDLKEAKKKGYKPCISCGADKIVMKEEKNVDKKSTEKKEEKK